MHHRQYAPRARVRLTAAEAEKPFANIEARQYQSDPAASMPPQHAATPDAAKPAAPPPGRTAARAAGTRLSLTAPLRHAITVERASSPP